MDLEKEIQKYQESFDKKTLEHSFRNISWEFLDASDKRRRIKLIENSGFILEKTKVFEKALENNKIKSYPIIASKLKYSRHILSNN